MKNKLALFSALCLSALAVHAQQEVIPVGVDATGIVRKMKVDTYGNILIYPDGYQAPKKKRAASKPARKAK